MLLVDLLVLFNLNFFYIRAILAFIFIITIPGLLIMLCLKIRDIGFWEYLVYTIGLSIAFIMFAGLHANWTLPALHITDKPLSTIPILIEFNIFLLILGFFAYKRNSDFSFSPRLPKFSILDRIFFVIPMFFPVLSIFGAFLLNNHGPNYLTMIMLGAIAVYVFLFVLLKDKLNENIYPWAIWMISSSLLFMVSLRGWGVQSHDIIYEVKVFRITQINSLWDINNFKNAYNACLSLNILPSIINLFGKVGENVLFKFLLVLITSLIPLVFFRISNIFLKNKIYSFFSAFFIITHTIFIIEMPMETRQSIALFFFSLMLLVLFSKNISLILKKLLFVIFGFSMIVSHYSTAYIALAIFLLAYILTLIYKLYEKKKIKKGKIKPSEKQEFYLTGILILLLLIFGFLWYSQITPTATGLIDTIYETSNNLGNLFKDELKQQDTNLVRQINIFYKPEDLTKTLNAYQDWSSSSNSSETIKQINYPLNLVYPKIIKNRINPTVPQFIFLFGNLITMIFRGFILLGIILVFLKRRKLNINIQYLLMAIISALFLFLILTLPVLSASYSTARFYIQTLAILSPFAFFTINMLSHKIINPFKNVIIIILLIFLLLLSTGFIYQVIGGYYPEYTLNNQGDIFDRLHFFKSNALSINWLLHVKGFVNADSTSIKRLIVADYKYNLISDDVVPSKIKPASYVLESYTNNFAGRAFKTFNNRLIFYNFPKEFLNDNKNKIYNNGGSEVFK